VHPELLKLRIDRMHVAALERGAGSRERRFAQGGGGLIDPFASVAVQDSVKPILVPDGSNALRAHRKHHAPPTIKSTSASANSIVWLSMILAISNP
jgi:hypothetical protein